MKYIIVSYTSDIDIKTNIAKVRYAKIRYVNTEVFGQVPTLEGWVEDSKYATRFNTRAEAEELVKSFNQVQLIHTISYGIEE